METETPNGVAIKHADHGLGPEHVALLDRVLKSKSGFFVTVVDLPDGLADLQSALYGPAAGDDPVIEDDVEYVKRGERPGPSRLIDAPCRPCRRMVVVGISSPTHPVIFTAYGTQSATPSPREWWDSSMRPSEAIKSAQFWAEHALAREA